MWWAFSPLDSRKDRGRGKQGKTSHFVRWNASRWNVFLQALNGVRRNLFSEYLAARERHDVEQGRHQQHFREGRGVRKGVTLTHRGSEKSEILYFTPIVARLPTRPRHVQEFAERRVHPAENRNKLMAMV